MRGLEEGETMRAKVRQMNLLIVTDLDMFFVRLYYFFFIEYSSVEMEPVWRRGRALHLYRLVHLRAQQC